MRFQAPRHRRESSSEFLRHPPRPPAGSGLLASPTPDPGFRTGASRRWTRGGTHDGPGSQQLGEPHDRFQGATNLKGTRWSKPPQPGGTARAERVREVATPGRRHPAPDGTSFRGGTRKQLFGAGDRWEWTPGADADGGANFDNPKRGVLLPGSRRAESRKARRPTDRRETGRRIEDSVFVGEAKVMRAGPLVDPTPRRA